MRKDLVCKQQPVHRSVSPIMSLLHRTLAVATNCCFLYAQGCTASTVVQGSIAWKNGLREKDVILAYCVEYQGSIDRLNLNPRQSFFDADLQHAVKGSKSVLIVIERPLPGAESSKLLHSQYLGIYTQGHTTKTIKGEKRLLNIFK